ncbi:hypothetical protein ACTFIR_012289 [Dictyostelium discoideum]
MSIQYSPIVSYQFLEVEIRDLDRRKVWDDYYQHWLKLKSGYSLEELFVFHGTSLNDPSLICANGLRAEKTRSGLYFSIKSSESNGFTYKSTDCSQILMCRILVPHQNESPRFHVIKNNDHHYPQYLISYNSKFK